MSVYFETWQTVIQSTTMAEFIFGSTEGSFLQLMQVSISSVTIPPGQTLENHLKRAKAIPLGQSLCTKTLPSGQKRESKAPLQGNKVREFHKYIYEV